MLSRSIMEPGGVQQSRKLTYLQLPLYPILTSVSVVILNGIVIMHYFDKFTL